MYRLEKFVKNLSFPQLKIIPKPFLDFQFLLDWLVDKNCYFRKSEALKKWSDIVGESTQPAKR